MKIMRGKSIDTDFVSDFIQECAKENKTSPDEICEEALYRISEIDKQLKIRMKLADVLSFFKFKKKNNVLIEEKNENISFDHLFSPSAEEIVNIIGDDNILLLSSLFNTHSLEHKKELTLTLKQMLKCNLLTKISGELDRVFARGERYEQFVQKLHLHKEKNMAPNLS